MQHVAAVTLCASVFITFVALPSTHGVPTCRRDATHLCRGEVKAFKSNKTGNHAPREVLST
ncbi:hypothetical protein [Pararobbsia silviterrae]|uniref:Uncharacterized protein n=1 Tax=Pararobbsia silviterrae TaxID=1792498 RepID=A0A494Y9G9_9BURK|nr:hypothetical protein [Pararobbsia silviterrae]RKP59279.1 hypothetical protein D7S86_05185 [Pararobbsia silviterrae]